VNSASGSSAAGGSASSSSSNGGSAAAGAGEDPESQSAQDKAGKQTGLDRADQAAGEHGQQGRDNAREKQSR
jgi:hypothetical protein